MCKRTQSNYVKLNYGRAGGKIYENENMQKMRRRKTLGRFC